MSEKDFWEGYVPEPVKPAQQEPKIDIYRSFEQWKRGNVLEQALDKKAENARELGLDYEPAQQEPDNSDDLTIAYMAGVQRGKELAQRTWVGLTDEQIDAEFDAFASNFDHESNEWLDMGVDAYFRAGFKAAHNIKENT